MRKYVDARFLAILLIKRYLNMSLKAIGQEFGGRDHTTMIYNINAGRDLVSTNESFRNLFDQANKMVKNKNIAA